MFAGVVRGRRLRRVRRLPDELDHEGAGDALPFFDEAGRPCCSRATGPAATPPPGRCCPELLGCPVRSVELVDERLYHVDLTFCPLDERRAICAPLGWDAYGRKVVEALVPEPLWLEDDEALSFCANSVVVDTNIVMPVVPPRVGRHPRGLGLLGGRVARVASS